VNQYFDAVTMGGLGGALSKLGNEVIFSTFPSSGGGGDRVWLTDGTTAGTRPFPIPASGDPVDEIVQGSDGTRALISVRYSDGTTNLWSTDGTVNGTREIAGNHPGGHVVGSVNGKTLFTFNQGLSDAELWSTDGTAAGTQLLTHYDPNYAGGVRFAGTDGEFIRYLNAVYFANTDPEHGTELWRTDGTVAGTRLYTDLTPGADSSNPRPYGVVGTHMLFGVGTDLRNGAIMSLTNIAVANPPVDQASPPMRVTLGTDHRIKDDVLQLGRAEDALP